MASWHDARRMQLERVHLQHSLFDDPPVLIRATPLPEVTNGGSAASLPFTTDLPPAVHPDPLSVGRVASSDHLLPDRRAGGEVGGGSDLTDDNERRTQSLPGTRVRRSEGA